MKVLVTGADQHQGLAVIRGLGIVGIPVIACGASNRSMGFYSRFAVARARYVSPFENPTAFVDDIVRIAQQTGASLIMPAVESTVVVLNQWRAVIERYATLAAPDADLLEYAIDKEKTVALARRLGVPTPRTVVGKSIDEILTCASGLQFPLAIKPRGNSLHHTTANTLGFKVRYAQTLDELSERLQQYERDVGALLVQEYISGVGRCVAGVCRHGEPLALLAYSREREFPLSGGVSVVRRTIPLDESMRRHATALLREIGWHGVAMVEFKYDGRTRDGNGPYVLMEINGRFQASTALSLDAGLNLPGLVAALYDARKTPTPSRSGLPPYRIGVTERWLRGDLMALFDALAPRAASSMGSLGVARRPSRARVFWNFLRDFRPGMRYDEFKWYDVKPGIVELGALAGVLAALVKRGLWSIARQLFRSFSARVSRIGQSPAERSVYV